MMVTTCIRDLFENVWCILTKHTFPVFLGLLLKLVFSYIYIGLFTFICRCFTICSDKKIHLELESLQDIFRKNGYPASFIDKCIKKFIDKLYTPKHSVATVSKKELLLVLPYLGKMSLQNRTQLCKLVRDCFPFCKVNFVFKTTVRLSNFFKYKDKICKDLCSGGVYKFACCGCNATYYGKTKRHFKVRYSDHNGLSALTGKRIKASYLSTAVKDHLMFCVYTPSFDNFSIFAYSENNFYT